MTSASRALTRRLAALLSAPAVLAGFSRLLIDPNRGEDDPTLIRQLYDGTVVPGNYPLTADEREPPAGALLPPLPRCDRSTGRIGGRAKRARRRSSSRVHSFTPVMGGQVRPWHVGMLWDMDHRAAWPLIEMLAEDHALVVGDNEPYDGALRGDTMFRHAIVSGFAHALIEVRQDLIADEAGAADWAAAAGADR